MKNGLLKVNVSSFIKMYVDFQERIFEIDPHYTHYWCNNFLQSSTLSRCQRTGGRLSFQVQFLKFSVIEVKFSFSIPFDVFY